MNYLIFGLIGLVGASGAYAKGPGLVLLHEQIRPSLEKSRREVALSPAEQDVQQYGQLASDFALLRSRMTPELKGKCLDMIRNAADVQTVVCNEEGARAFEANFQYKKPFDAFSLHYDIQTFGGIFKHDYLTDDPTLTFSNDGQKIASVACKPTGEIAISMQVRYPRLSHVFCRTK